MEPIPVETWEGTPVDEWRRRWGVPLLQVYHRIGSTNDVARALAQGGAPQGAVVLAREQTAGRGRRGRAWTAAPGESLLLSMVLRPVPGARTLLSLRLGLQAARAIEDLTSAAIQLKWPNDLLTRGRKVGGILCEATVEGEGPGHVIAGIGINLTQRDDDWPAGLADAATSLAAAAEPVETAALAGRLVTGWLAVARRAAGDLSTEEVREIERRDILRGRALTVDGDPVGVGLGIAPDGALLVREGRRTRRVVAGTVRPIDDPEGALS